MTRTVPTAAAYRWVCTCNISGNMRTHTLCVCLLLLVCVLQLERMCILAQEMSPRNTQTHSYHTGRALEKRGLEHQLTIYRSTDGGPAGSSNSWWLDKVPVLRERALPRTDAGNGEGLSFEQEKVGQQILVHNHRLM